MTKSALWMWEETVQPKMLFWRGMRYGVNVAFYRAGGWCRLSPRQSPTDQTKKARRGFRRPRLSQGGNAKGGASHRREKMASTRAGFSLARACAKFNSSAARKRAAPPA